MRPVIKIYLQKILTTLFCWLCFSSTGFTQNQQVRIFGLQDENKRIQVNVIFKNKVGYIFVGTNNGLYKFDGIKFHPVHFANKSYTDTVSAIFQTKSGQYWVGFKSGRLANIINGQLSYLDLEEGHPAQKITSFLEDSKGIIWFSTNGEGLYYFREKRLYLLNEENGLPDKNISSLALAANGDILAASDQGLICISTAKNYEVSVIGPAQGLPDYIVTAIANAGKDLFWIGMQDKGFCLYNHVSAKVTLPMIEPWAFGQVNALHATPTHLFIGTQYEGVLKFDATTKSFSKIQRITSPQIINDLVQDDQGNIWASDPDAGLLRMSGDEVKFLPLPEGTVFEHIHALLADKQGNLWVTNANNELIVQSPSIAGQKRRIRIAGIDKSTDITALYQDLYNNIWIGTVGKGLYILDPATFTYRSFDENPLFKNATVLKITGKDNNIYVSTLQGSMAVKVGPQNQTISNRYTFKDFDNAGIRSNYIYFIYQDTKDRIWFATDGRGISVIDKGGLTNYSSEDLIKDDRIYSITEDFEGNIWFSTASAGIYKFDDTRFTNFGIREGMSDLNISAIKTDKHGNIVSIHRKGLDILNPATGRISYINNNKGIDHLNVEDLGAIAQDTSRNIYVSSPQAIVVYSPAASITQQPKTIIESVQLFLTDLPDNTSPIFSHEDNNFTFNYTGLYYTDPDQVYYQYKLEGFDTTWILTKDRSKTFPKLAPGKYRFRIQSALNKSFIRADEASFAFEIRQAFYKKWWFISGVLLLLIFGLFAYIRNRESGIRKMQRLQQEKIQFRFEVLRNQVNPHFLFNSFNTLISTIEDDPKLAVEYVEHLSDFFRNIVNYRDKDIIPLSEEISLLNIYYFLQKKRYGDNLRLTINLSEHNAKETFVPPLTLQLLLENAIKHNAITKESPLNILIETNEQDYLSITNNITPRLSKETGAGMGLQNIISRYHLLTAKDVKVSETANDFVVSLPLIKVANV